MNHQWQCFHHLYKVLYYTVSNGIFYHMAKLQTWNRFWLQWEREPCFLMAWEHRSVASGFCDCAALSFTLCFEQICLCYCSICAGSQRSYTDSYQQPYIVGKAKCEPLQRGASFCLSLVLGLKCGVWNLWRNQAVDLVVYKWWIV
jgi:hypothetical protein